MPSSDHPVDANSSAAETVIVRDPEKEDEEEEERPLPLRITIITFALALSSFIAAVEVTVVTTALLDIAASLDASPSGYSSIGTAYLLAFAALTPFWSKLSDIFASPASLMCCLPRRAVQGAGGGGLVVLVQINIGDLVSMRLVALITPSPLTGI
ncbi:hypothetical protein MMC18_008980 [Xylographa bjoerkii]|nr:hypothetical protein [Xylographa bjoerkii]